MFESRNRRFRVVLDSSDLTFNAMHFVSFPSDDSREPWIDEPIHGHDFRVALTVEGALDEADCVVDFVAARRAAFRVMRPLNHRLILARGRSSVQYVERFDVGEVEVRFMDASPPRRYVFPRKSVAWLDANNASTEEIAARLLDDWIDELERSGALVSTKRRKFTLRLEEAPGVYAEVERET